MSEPLAECLLVRHLATGKVYVDVAVDDGKAITTKALLSEHLAHHDHPCKPLQALYDETPTLTAFAITSVLCWSAAHAQMVRDKLMADYLHDGMLLNVLTQLV